MVGSLALFAENKVLEHAVGKTSWTMPSEPYLALFTTAPTSEDGTGGVECDAGNYARITCPGTNWGAAAAGAIANSVAIEFAEASGANWGNVKGFALFNAITEGDMILWGEVTTPKDINIGDTAKFAIGELDVTLD